MFSRANLRISVEWESVFFLSYNNHKDCQSQQPLSSAPTPSFPLAPTNPPSTNLGPLQHKQQRVVTHSTPCASPGSGRPPAGCVYHQTHMSVWGGCQIASNSSHPTLKYLQHLFTHWHTRTHTVLSGSISWSVWPQWMWISAEALTTEVWWGWSDALN